MPKLLPFPARSVKKNAEKLRLLIASRETLSAPELWHHRPVPPERLGNMLQHLLLHHPAAVVVLENIVADLLTILEP